MLQNFFIFECFVGASKGNDTSEHWVCAQRVMQQHKQHAPSKHKASDIKSPHVGHNVRQLGIYSPDTFEYVLLCLKYEKVRKKNYRATCCVARRCCLNAQLTLPSLCTNNIKEQKSLEIKSKKARGDSNKATCLKKLKDICSKET